MGARRMSRPVRSLMCLFFAWPACHAAEQRPAAVGHPAGARVAVVSDRGPVVGVERGDVRVFLGIPYAAPPTGDRRWRPPEPAAAWSAPREATREGHACLQMAHGKRDRDSDEDCL